MPVEDTRPDITRAVAELVGELGVMHAKIATGRCPASTALFRELCQLAAVTERLRRACELELSVRLGEAPPAPAAPAAVLPSCTCWLATSPRGSNRAASRIAGEHHGTGCAMRRRSPDATNGVH